MIEVNKQKLRRVEKLIRLTTEEGEYLKMTVTSLKDDTIKLVGDIFLAAVSISYIGPFIGVYLYKI